MTTLPQSWHKSSYSEASNSCVEVRRGDAGTAVRDTKNRAAGQLAVSAAAWLAFLERATR